MNDKQKGRPRKFNHSWVRDEWTRRKLETPSLTKSKFAKELGYSRRYLSRIIRDESNWRQKEIWVRNLHANDGPEDEQPEDTYQGSNLIVGWT